MRRYSAYLAAPLLILIFAVTVILTANKVQNNTSEFYDFSSTASTGTYGSIEPLKQKYVQEVASKFNSSELMNAYKLREILSQYNNQLAPKLNTTDDNIDAFVGLLPKSYRRHFSMVHRSFSIQKATPMAPRIIMYGTDAKVMMTFNGGHDFEGKPMAGGDSIEIIEWNAQKKTWDFSEITFDSNKRALHNTNPQKCVMCHAGTPKPVDFKNIGLYKDKLKPIFPQYPFWPGFYGSVNDIVGLESPQSRDTIMRNLPATLSQIKGLTFSETEELFRLRKLLDENPKYLEVVKNELDVHSKNFTKFMDSTKSRKRYRHLVTLKELYTDQQQAVPEYLKTAPYRRTFDKEYGHYLLRPNFYLSSLMTFYHSQFIAKEIEASPVYQQVKNSFLARKLNCGDFQASGMSLSDLDPSFDLLYPNQSTQEARDKQYLLSYQYNIVAAVKKSQAALPLHAWNLEANEDIASYHYGNVFSDLNEVVLWRLATKNFAQIQAGHGRSAAEERHYSLPNSTFLKQYLDDAGGTVSRMGNKQMLFSQSLSPYYGTAAKFKALPVSAYCDTLFIPAARSEMQNLARLKQAQQLPHQVYSLDSRLYDISEILGPNHKAGLNMVRQACESCHSDNTLPKHEQIDPRINVDWFSDSYHHDIKQSYVRMHGANKLPVELKKVIDEVLNESTLPVPFENSMPFARRPMDDFARQCELALVQANYNANESLKGKAFNCNTQQDPNSLGCKCRKLSLTKDRIYKEFYPGQ